MVSRRPARYHIYVNVELIMFGIFDPCEASIICELIPFLFFVFSPYQFSALTGSAPQIYPETALEFVLMKVPELLDRDSRPTDKLDEKGRVTNLTTGYITLESFASPLERIMSSLAEVYKDGVGHQDALNKVYFIL